MRIRMTLFLFKILVMIWIVKITLVLTIKMAPCHLLEIINCKTMQISKSQRSPEVEVVHIIG